MTSDTTGSAHDQPNRLFSTNPQDTGEVGAQQSLLGVGDGAGGAEFPPGATLGGREYRHHQHR